MGRTESFASGYAPDPDEFDPRTDEFVSKERNYIHFDLRLSEARRTGLSFTPQQILTYDFWPLLAYDSVERRAKKDIAGNTYFEEKVRPIKFAAHLDAALLEWYGRELGQRYECYLQGCDFDNSVLAYRSGVGDNISHASGLFEEIKYRGECTAIAVDISGFFDNIDHHVLMTALREVTSSKRLANPDFKIFEFMTKFSWVEADELKFRLGGRYGRRGRICSADEFRRFVRGRPDSLIQRNPNAFGIPQGTPLSGLYANISMVSVDQAIHDYVSQNGGSYRRYSDDIAVVMPGLESADAIVSMISEVLRSVGLTLSGHKTEVRQFTRNAGRQIANKPFQYLGFTFDGEKTLIRQSSLNRYYSKMHKGIRAKIRAAKNKGVPRDEVYLRELYRKYTHFGKSRNFPRYAYRAARDLNAPEIRGQMRSHFRLFKAALSHYLDRAYS
ncbi:MAG: group II intron reverse transcriptase domain-containing protein [Porphyrobacter sp.]|nr:group II intron reverse transcriptase domain-containing protein [Porphyrobacter sp.]